MRLRCFLRQPMPKTKVSSIACWSTAPIPTSQYETRKTWPARRRRLKRCSVLFSAIGGILQAASAQPRGKSPDPSSRTFCPLAPSWMPSMKSHLRLNKLTGSPQCRMLGDHDLLILLLGKAQRRNISYEHLQKVSVGVCRRLWSAANRDFEIPSHNYMEAHAISPRDLSQW